MRKQDVIHKILNAWIDQGIDNGVFYGLDEVTELRRDLECASLEHLATSYRFWTGKEMPILLDNVIEEMMAYKKPVCTCGAKHTSNPKFHLRYCDIKE